MDQWPYPSNMTIKQLIDAGYLENPNEETRSLFEVAGMPEPEDMYDNEGRHITRYSKEYETWSGYEMPKRINKTFWVGVRSGIIDWVPVPRNKTNCFKPCPVFQSGSELIFDIEAPIYSRYPSLKLYSIPMNEKWAIQ